MTSSFPSRVARSAAASVLAGAALALDAPTLAAEEFTQHAAHEHGRATLDLAVDGGAVSMRLSVAAMDIVGFEHAPRTDAERGAADSARTVLRLHEALFAFPVAARCTSTGAEVTPPAWHGGDDAGKHGAGDGKHADEHETAADHDHADGHETHADYVANWTFTCAAPAALRFVDVKIPERFGKDLVVVANVLTDSVQTRQELRTGAVRVQLR